jgi:hypothetical protein
MLNKLLTVSILALLLTISPAESQQQRSCQKIGDIEKHLQSQFGERPVFTGVSVAGFIQILFYNPKTFSYSVGVVYPDNPDMICYVDSGVGTFEKLLVEEEDS